MSDPLAMSAEDDAPYHCIPQARCRLCQFELEEGEDVIAGTYLR
jgi:hypothetical protein